LEGNLLSLLRVIVILGGASTAFAQYAGPAILSRGDAPAAMGAPKVEFSFSVALTGNYTNGLAGVSAPDAKGQLADQTAYGGGVTLGVSGAHTWKHTHVGLNYSGSFFHYSTAGYFDGISQGLSLALSHQFTRHIQMSVRESAGIFTQFAPATVSLNSSIPFDPSQSYIPTADFYDNRTIYNTSQVDLTYQKTTRLSFNFGGAYFTNIRRSNALFGSSGVSASGDVQYRLSRRSTVGGVYSYSHYGYTGSAGGADIHTAGASLSLRLSRWTEFSFFGGAARVESNFEQTQAIDPSILAILCPPSLNLPCPLSTGTFKRHTLFWGPDFGARYSRSFRRGVAFVSVGESIIPGNGLFLTSRQAIASAGYGYSGLRKWNLNIGVRYATALSLGNVQGGYGQVAGLYGLSRQIVKSLNFVSSFAATQYQSGSFGAYNRLIYSASIGLGFSSNNVPLRFF
jgi:hypothetical protein